MKLAAIYNVFDGEELLTGSINCLIGQVDVIIFVLQTTSNFGEYYDPRCKFHCKGWNGLTEIQYHYDPIMELGGTQNEIKKRNIGLDLARDKGCTHFFHIDVDEYYENFAKAKEEFIQLGIDGSVCPIYTYFKKPTWRLENLDNYFVPFIHELKEDTRAGNCTYPVWVDPTRTIHPHSKVAILSEPMHHYSWVRNDIERKARNSSAGQHGNKLKGLLADYHSPELEAHPDGYVIKDMGGQRIKVVDDLFGISKMLDKS